MQLCFYFLSYFGLYLLCFAARVCCLCWQIEFLIWVGCDGSLVPVLHLNKYEKQNLRVVPQGDLIHTTESIYRDTIDRIESFFLYYSLSLTHSNCDFYLICFYFSVSSKPFLLCISSQYCFWWQFNLLCAMRVKQLKDSTTIQFVHICIRFSIGTH